MASFDEFTINHALCYHFFCDLSQFDRSLGVALEAIEGHHTPCIEKIAAIIYNIAKQVLGASNLDSAWFCLRSFLPPDNVPLKRWHMDGRHYRTEGEHYKFCITLKGDPTQFYLLSRDLQNLRRVVWKNMEDVKFTNELCQPHLIFRQDRKEGVFFNMARASNAALHAEPVIIRPRLFFSIVPCQQHQLSEIKTRIEVYSPASEKVIYKQSV